MKHITDSTIVRSAVIGVLVFLSLFLIAETAAVIQGLGRVTTPAADTIVVSASGQATMPPDVAKVSFTVQNTAATVAEAQTATTKQANAALAFVKQQEIEDKDVRTTSYTISPQYSYERCAVGTICPSTPKITGYQVAESVQVTIRDLAKVGSFLQGLGKLQVQNVSGPSFTLDDTTAGYDAARADAIMKAKTQARLLAEQLDVHLGNIVSFNESSGSYPVAMYAKGIGGATMDSAAAPTIPVGENTYNASVSITYEIR